MTDIGGSIAVDDLKKHQMQLVESLRKVKGYENVNFIDVMQYPDGKGRLVGMPVKELYQILNESDAAKATSAKKDEANRKFLMDNNLIKPDGGVKAFSYYDGKLTVDGETRDAVLATGAVSFETGKLLPNKLEISSNQSGSSTPGAPTPPTTTVAYQQAQSAAKGSSGATSSASPGGSVPDFSASAKVDSRKVKVLGISR